MGAGGGCAALRRAGGGGAAGGLLAGLAWAAMATRGNAAIGARRKPTGSHG